MGNNYYPSCAQGSKIKVKNKIVKYLIIKICRNMIMLHTKDKIQKHNEYMKVLRISSNKRNINKCNNKVAFIGYQPEKN